MPFPKWRENTGYSIAVCYSYCLLLTFFFRPRFGYRMSGNAVHCHVKPEKSAMAREKHSAGGVLKLGSWINGLFVPHNSTKTTYAESTLMETPDDEIVPNNGTRHVSLPVRACQLDFCRAKSVNWSRVYSMNKARQMDQWLELKTDGFEHAMNRAGKSIYVCKKHFKEAETRKQENVVGFLRLVEKDVAEFCGDAIVSDVSDSRKLFPKKDRNYKKKTSFLNDDSISEDVKPSAMELKQLLDGSTDCVSTRDNNGSGVETPKEENVADNRPKPVARTCQVEFCRTKSINYARLYSMTKARQLDHWLGLINDGFEQALKSTEGKSIYVCARHTEEAEIRKQQQSLSSFLREFGDSRVSGVHDCLSHDNDSYVEDIKPYVNEMMHGPASETGTNTKKRCIEVLRTKGPRCATHGVPTKAEEIALRLCYWKCLKSAVDRRLLRIGFPLIGTGLGGYPRSEGLMVALDTVLAFFETSPVKGLNVSICVSGDGARDVLEFGAILMGKELSFKLEKHTVHRVRSTMEDMYAKLMGLSETPRKAYELPSTTISFPTYVKMKDEETGRGYPYRKRKRTRLREGKANDKVKLEPLDEIQDDELFRETKENMTQLANQMPENPDYSTLNDVVANLFGPSETAERVRLLKDEEVEPPCLNPEW